MNTPEKSLILQCKISKGKSCYHQSNYDLDYSPRMMTVSGVLYS